MYNYKCNYGFSRQLSNRKLSRTIKLLPYKSRILSELLYGAKTWTVLTSDIAALEVFKRCSTQDLRCRNNANV